MSQKRRADTVEGQDKQLAILDAADAVFMKLGFAANSLDDISDSYGATKGIIIYYYCGNNSELFFAVQRRATELTRVVIEPAAFSEKSRRIRLGNMAHAHTLLMMKHLPYIRVAAHGLELHLNGRTSAQDRAEMKAITEMRDSSERL